MDTAAPVEDPEEAFERYRPLLFAIAYRMTGSASEAEDLTQETYLRYQASARNGDVKIISPKAYLTTIITRLAQDYLKSARVARERYIGTWLPEPLLTADESGAPLAGLERQETLSLAFLRLLEALSPPERAVFLLHEVFDYSFSEIGPMLEKSPANCRQIFHRARLALQSDQARFTPQPERQRALLRSFLAATQAGDMATLRNLLAEDVVSWSDAGGKERSPLKPLFGVDVVAQFWGRVVGANLLSLTITPAEINGAPAYLFWLADRLVGIVGMTTSDSTIQEIYALLNPDKLEYLRRQLARRG